jgi:hypothetical protein
VVGPTCGTVGARGGGARRRQPAGLSQAVADHHAAHHLLRLRASGPSATALLRLRLRSRQHQVPFIPT